MPTTVFIFRKKVWMIVSDLFQNYHVNIYYYHLAIVSPIPPPESAAGLSVAS